MSTRAWNGLRNERGMSLVFVGLGLMGFVAATMLAIDVGMLMTARSQAQNSADAGAHAGAVALAFDDYNDRSETGPAVTNALREARANQVMDAVVTVEPEDVEFLNDPTGEPNRVRVTVHRAGGNAVGLLMAPVFGIDTADIHATATAEASPADVPDYCLPFTIPDKWIERTSTPPVFDSETSTFESIDKHGNPLSPADDYNPLRVNGIDQPDYTGYDAYEDRGSVIVLKASNSTKVSPSEYNPIVLPGSESALTGAERFYQSILTGRCGGFRYGSPMTPEPGMMAGKTREAIQQLIDQDPDAHYDTDCRCVKGSTNPDHPRVRAIPVYDPQVYDTGKQTGRNADWQLANYVGVFIVELRGDDVVARIVPLSGTRSGDPNMPGGMNVRTVRIVQ